MSGQDTGGRAPHGRRVAEEHAGEVHMRITDVLGDGAYFLQKLRVVSMAPDSIRPVP